MSSATEEATATALARVVASLPDGGELREGQREMALAVSRAIAEDRHLVVRAGTGTGKSLAYLVPVALSGKKTLIATATKALQHQLVEKDLPSLAGKVGVRLRFALLKGRSNYLCVQRLVEMGARGEQAEFLTEQGGVADTGTRAAEVRRIVEWSATTPTGDQAELDFEPDAGVWGSVSVSAEECPGAFHCPSGASCFAEMARARAAEAEIVVINLHLLGAHLASDGAVLPEHEVLVIDEAHELEEIMSRSLGLSIGPGRLRAIAAMTRAARPTTAPAQRGGRGEGLEESALLVMDSATELETLLEARKGNRFEAGTDIELARFVELLQGRLERLDRDLRAALPGGVGVENPKTQRAILALTRLRNEVAYLVGATEDQVVWVAFGARPSLEVAPIDVAPLLERELFAKTPVVMTSATVPLNLGTHLGSHASRTDALDVGSPFDFANQALLYCAAHLPDRRSATAEAAMVEEILALITAAGGRTLALFTSRAVMERVSVEVRERLSLPILVQGERSKASLVEAIATEPATSLFATMGFWQGVDIPGAALSLVIIDRIPFARPDDPLLSARRDRAGAAAFKVIDLPRAGIMLAQGAGRLIRTQQDRGVVAVLDSRLATANYRWELIRALPPMRRTKDRTEACNFLATIDAEARHAEKGPN